MDTVPAELRDEGMKPFGAVMNGALVRLRTVLMTGTLAMLGLLPMALSHGVGSETQKPLTVVIIGGLISGDITHFVCFTRRLSALCGERGGAHIVLTPTGRFNDYRPCRLYDGGCYLE